MPKRPLPKILEREPLVDAVFEVRMSGTPPLADILTGFLFHDLGSNPALTRLPAAEVPQPMRVTDPGLQFAPLLRLEWGQYFIAVGDRVVVVSCKLPYPKWPNFKKAILDVMQRIAKVGISGQVDRFSLKYVNLIPSPTLADQTSKIIMSVTLGEVEVKADHVTLQVHRNEGDILHIMTVIIGAEGNFPGGKRVPGAVVDIDSIRTVGAADFRVFADGLEPDLEHLRQANKEKFFGCLTDAAIQEMGPVYE